MGENKEKRKSMNIYQKKAEMYCRITKIFQALK